MCKNLKKLVKLVGEEVSLHRREVEIAERNSQKLGDCLFTQPPKSNPEKIFVYHYFQKVAEFTKSCCIFAKIVKNMSRRIKSNPFLKEENHNRYCLIGNIKDTPDRFILYDNAQGLVEELRSYVRKIGAGRFDRTHVIVNGSFIFGDFLSEFVIQYGQKIKSMTISTLSFSEANVEVMSGLLKNGWVDELNLIVSIFFYGHKNQRKRFFYAVKELDNNKNNFQIAVERSHCKYYIFETYDGRHFVIHGSANMVTSDNFEQFTIEDNKELYDFFYKFSQKSLEKNRYIDKNYKFKRVTMENVNDIMVKSEIEDINNKFNN